jgi:kynurenine formamidase
LGTGFFAEVFTLVGQWGTHEDPPAHFIKGSQQGSICGRSGFAARHGQKIAWLS